MSEKGEQLISKLNELGITPEHMVVWLGIYSNFEEPKWPLSQKGFNDLVAATAGYVEDSYEEEDDKPVEKFTLEQAQELGEIKFIESGGVHHDGGPIWSVFYFKNFDIYLAAEATYSSWDSEYFSKTWVEVKEKEVTITQWLDPKGRALA